MLRQFIRIPHERCVRAIQKGMVFFFARLTIDDLLRDPQTPICCIHALRIRRERNKLNACSFDQYTSDGRKKQKRTGKFSLETFQSDVVSAELPEEIFDS